MEAVQLRARLAAVEAVLDMPSSKTTRVLLLDGPAGVGKTRLLERLTAQRASEYLRGKGRPILYVGSRGRRLSNLPDTLAGATQVLRTRFTYEHVPLLVRAGLIDLAIDGFDELVDADGYQDAWYALREFLGQLDGTGTCILAGRDTFFDQQGFLKRLQAVEGTIELIQAHLGPVSSAKAKEWLSERGWSSADVDSDETADLLQPGSYLLRPYFLSQLSEVSGWQELADAGSARAFLVARFIGRESEIVSQSVAISSEDARAGVSTMLQEAALDMAERESVEVDVEYLALLCEVAFSDVLKAEDVRKLQHKAGAVDLHPIRPEPLVELPSDRSSTGLERLPRIKSLHA